MEAPASEVLVGRARELAQLERALDATRAGSGTTALVTGEAGIGKTRLASEAARRAREAGFEVLLGRSIDLVGTELPYQPLLEALHWADTSTLDLVVFLAHNLHDRPVLLLATYRADELASAVRVRRLADGVRRSGSMLLLELGPLQHEELTALPSSTWSTWCRQRHPPRSVRTPWRRWRTG